VRRLGRVIVGSALALAGTAVLPQPAGAIPKDGLVIACSDGRYLTRSNGVSWWEVDSPIAKETTGSVFTSRRIRVTYNGEVVHDKTYGTHAGQPTSTCSGPELIDGTTSFIPDSLWEVDLSGS
jgi:hypothetical protein